MRRYFDCEGCKCTTTQLQRQALGCGYEPPAPAGVRVVPWDHEGRVDSPPATTCPGYVCALPEVIEASHARLHWSKGALALYAPQASSPLLSAITILEREIGRAQDWAMDNPVKKDS